MNIRPLPAIGTVTPDAPALVGVPSNASAVGKPCDCRNFNNYRLQVRGAITGTPVGYFALYGTDDYFGYQKDKAAGTLGPGLGTCAWVPLNIPEQAVHGTGFTPFTDTTVQIAWDGTVAVNMAIDIDDPMMYMCPLWHSTSGGSASTDKIGAWHTGRGTE